jgi:sarcosine oxidase subunit beta
MVKTADVVIIGGGISGITTAYYLAKKGVKNVVVIEKDYLASGNTGRCGAGIRQQWGTEMNCRMAKLSCELFESCNEELHYEGDIEFKQGGYLLLAYTQKEYEQFKKNVILQNSLGIASNLVPIDRVKEIVPFISTDNLIGATFYEKDGHLNPFHTVQAYAKAAERLGAKIYKFTQVTDIITEGGIIKGVKTDKGLIHTGTVVNAAGAYSGNIAQMAGINIPVFSERHEILVTEALEPMLNPMVMSFSGNFYCQQVPHGGFVMGRACANQPKDVRTTSSWSFLDNMTKSITQVMPVLEKARVLRQWAGSYNITPDRQPILGGTDHVKGFYIAAGFSGHGFMFGPATGMLISQCILNEESELPIDMLNLSRFEKGELIFEPSVV